MIPVRLSPRAAADLDEIGEYIARDNPARAVTFVDELSAVCGHIAEHPEAYRTRDDLLPDLRMAIHRHYLILFRILPTEIRIERIVHGTRDLRLLWP